MSDRLIAAGTLTLLLAFGFACAEPEPTPFSVRLVAKAGDLPLPGVRFWAGGKDVGVTSADGQLATELLGFAGDTMEITTACPSGHEGPDEPRRLALRAHGKPVELSVQCKPLQQLAALVVTATHDHALHLPIAVNGEAVGQTNEAGHNHLLLKLQPGERVQVTLDTSAHPKLRPQNPVRTFQTGREDSILLFEQSFIQDRPKRTARRKAPRKRAIRKVPYRIQ